MLAGGFLARDWCDGGPVGALAQRSFALHAELAQKLDGARRYGYRRVDTFSVTIRPKPGKKACASSAPASGPLSWVDRESLGHSQAIGTPDDCAQVHPRQFTLALLEEVEAAGGRVELGVVTGITTDAGRVTGVKVTDRDGGTARTIPADTVVIAAGPWTGALRAAIPGLPYVDGQKAHSIVLEDDPADPIPAEALFLAYRGSDGKSQEPEIYPRPNGEVYVCGAGSDTPLPSFADQVLPDRGAADELAAAAGGTSRRLAGATRLQQQACYLPCTRSGLPKIGAVPGVKGVFVATGHSCWGILNAPATGLALAELIVDGRAVSVPLEPFAP